MGHVAICSGMKQLRFALYSGAVSKWRPPANLL